MPVEVTDATFQKEVLESKGPVLVDFWAEWCSPCQMIGPVVEEIATEYKGKVKVCKVNVEQAPGSASSYGVMSIPTLAVFKDGKVVDQLTGVAPKSKLEEMISPYV